MMSVEIYYMTFTLKSCLCFKVNTAKRPVNRIPFFKGILCDVC